MKEELLALIKYRLKEAEESLEEAKILLRENMSNRAIANRLYYAMFYAVLALLQEKQIGTSKHSGVLSAFDREFIKLGILDKKLSKTLHQAFKLRQKGDYIEQVEISKEDIDELLPDVKNFVTIIKKHLLKQ